jgi:hypothetical protein
MANSQTVEHLWLLNRCKEEPSSMTLMLKICGTLSFGALVLFVVSIPPAPARQNEQWANSPLAAETQRQLDGAGRLMKSGKYERAKPMVLAMLASANDVPKCLAIADYTEAYSTPLLDIRRDCCNKALSLCSSEDDYLLMALKARRYQFYEITRQSISKLIENARTLPQLFSLARKAQELSLNDVANLALEKAATGLRTMQDWFNYADTCKALGMEDLLRKAIKHMIDGEEDSSRLCDLALELQHYGSGIRDQIRYCLRKALDKIDPDLQKATNEMTRIADAARELNEPDVKLRAEFFVKKGHLMLKQRGEEAEGDRRARAEREQKSLDDARLRDQSGFGGEHGKAGEPPGKASSGY